MERNVLPGGSVWHIQTAPDSQRKTTETHTYKQLLPPARPPPPCSCHWLCKKIKKERKGLEKTLGPLADSAHSEAEEGKKLWKQEPRNGMDSQDTFFSHGWSDSSPSPFALRNLLPGRSSPIHAARNVIYVACCLKTFLEERKAENK